MRPDWCLWYLLSQVTNQSTVTFEEFNFSLIKRKVWSIKLNIYYQSHFMDAKISILEYFCYRNFDCQSHADCQILMLVCCLTIENFLRNFKM